MNREATVHERLKFQFEWLKCLGFAVHEIFQAILEQIAIPSFRGFSHPDSKAPLVLAGQFSYYRATWEGQSVGASLF